VDHNQKIIMEKHWENPQKGIEYLESLIWQECYKSTPNEQEIENLYAAIAALEKLL